MTLYRYKAIDNNGAIQRGSIEADSIQEVKTILDSFKLSPITYSRDIRSYFHFKPHRRVLIELCIHLEQFEKAGIPLKKSLSEIRDLQKSSSFKSVVSNICRSIEEGDMLSVALSKHSQIFDAIFVSLIKMGEKTGNLGESYRQLIHHLEWMEETYSQTQKKLRYPIILGFVLIALITSLFTFLVPELLHFLDTTSKTISIATLLLIKLSSFFAHYVVHVFIGILVCIALCQAIFLFYPGGTLIKESLINQIPIIGKLKRYLILTQFFHMLSFLLRGKVDILDALNTTRLLFESQQISHIIRQIKSQVETGTSISQSFESIDKFPSFIIRMISIGEQTNTLADSLAHIKSHYEKQLRKQTDRLISSLEPIMLIVMGLVLAWIICAVFLPLYESFEQLQSAQ